MTGAFSVYHCGEELRLRAFRAASVIPVAVFMLAHCRESI